MDAILSRHKEVYDSEVRERMREAIDNAFICPIDDYQIPSKFGLFSEDGNLRVRRAIVDFFDQAKEIAKHQNLDTLGRLQAFQNDSVEVGEYRRTYDCFFGYVAPGNYPNQSSH